VSPQQLIVCQAKFLQLISNSSNTLEYHKELFVSFRNIKPNRSSRMFLTSSNNYNFFIKIMGAVMSEIHRAESLANLTFNLLARYREKEKSLHTKYMELMSSFIKMF